jgi:nitroimidazol reductase NimA-like FMN-containing flavoprotein (pyridoxamine 5'-phosphate oxidase superfamily)
MTTDEAEQVTGIEMSDEEIDEFLYEQGHGILSLSTDGEVYGVPISFGYDGENLSMHLLQFGEESRKVAYMAGTETACLTTYHVEGRFAWKSVVAQGPLREVPDEAIEHVEEALDDNGWFPTIFPPTAPMTDVKYVELTVQEASGRKGQAHQD